MALMSDVWECVQTIAYWLMCTFTAFALFVVVFFGFVVAVGLLRVAWQRLNPTRMTSQLIDLEKSNKAFRIGRLLLTKESGHLWWHESQEAKSCRMLVTTRRTLAWLESDQYSDTFIVIIDEDGHYVGIDAAMQERFDAEILEAVHGSATLGRLKGVGIPRQVKGGQVATVTGIDATPEDIEDPAWMEIQTASR